MTKVTRTPSTLPVAGSSCQTPSEKAASRCERAAACHVPAGSAQNLQLRGPRTRGAEPAGSFFGGPPAERGGPPRGARGRGAPPGGGEGRGAPPLGARSVPQKGGKGKKEKGGKLEGGARFFFAIFLYGFLPQAPVTP